MAPTTADFVTAVKREAWTQRRLGIAVERVTADARKGAPSQFCQTYGFNQGMSFTLKWYGDRNCSALALEWCRRMQFWFDLWLEQGDTKYRFSAEELLSYEKLLGGGPSATMLPQSGRWQTESMPSGASSHRALPEKAQRSQFSCQCIR